MNELFKAVYEHLNIDELVIELQTKDREQLIEITYKLIDDIGYDNDHVLSPLIYFFGKILDDYDKNVIECEDAEYDQYTFDALLES